jgi:hypothetical protein
MTTMLSLILAFMLSIGGSPAASVNVNPAGCPGDTGIQAPIDNNRPINRFFEAYREKTASRPISKKILEIPLIKQPKTQIRLRFSLSLKEELCLVGYKDSMNLYQAFNQNPVNFTDPFGRSHVGPSIVPCYSAAKKYNPSIANIYERVSTAAMMALGGGITAKMIGIKATISALLTLNITSTLNETVERRKAGQTPEQVNRAVAARLLMFGPFYKIITGKDFGTQKKVSIEDRVATAGEIIVGTVGFITGYKATGSNPSTFQLMDDAFSVLDFRKTSTGYVAVTNDFGLKPGDPLPDNLEIVVTGSNTKPGNFILREGIDTLPIGNVKTPGKSASIATDLTIEGEYLKMFGPERAANIRRGDTLSGAFVEDIRAAGFDVLYAPTKKNPYHVRIIPKIRSFDQSGRDWLSLAFDIIQRIKKARKN